MESLPIVDEKATLLNMQIKILFTVNIFYELSDCVELTVKRKPRLVKTFADIFDRNFGHINPTKIVKLESRSKLSSEIALGF